MYKIVFRRLFEVLVTLFCATLIIFVLTRLAPGDPVELLLGRPGEVAMSDTQAHAEKVKELRSQLGLDQNVMVQYIAWLKALVRFDLGTSIHTGRPVSSEIARRLPATILLSIPALLIQLVLGLLFGIISAVKAGKTCDSAIRLICITLASTPAFVIGLILLYLFAVVFDAYEIRTVASIERLWLPAITLGLMGTPQLIRIVRASMLAEFGQIYVLSALSRGLGRKSVVKHALRNALLPVSTMSALSLASLIGGAVVIESVFSWPGIGKYALDSILLHDYPVIQAYALVIVSLVIFINLLVDLMYARIDPRIHSKEKVGKEQKNV